VFNQDAVPRMDADGTKTTKVSIYHVSAVAVEELESVVELAIDFIWKMMHCSVVRVHLHHVRKPDGTMGANADYKRIFK
jgi:hypothetical protein